MTALQRLPVDVMTILSAFVDLRALRSSSRYFWATVAAELVSLSVCITVPRLRAGLLGWLWLRRTTTRSLGLRYLAAAATQADDARVLHSLAAFRDLRCLRLVVDESEAALDLRRLAAVLGDLPHLEELDLDLSFRAERGVETL